MVNNTPVSLSAVTCGLDAGTWISTFGDSSMILANAGVDDLNSVARFHLMQPSFQAQGQAVIGKSAFKLLAFGSAGIAEGSVTFKEGSEAHFAVNNTLADYDIQHWTSIQGSTLIANVNIMHKKVTLHLKEIFESPFLNWEVLGFGRDAFGVALISGEMCGFQHMVVFAVKITGQDEMMGHGGLSVSTGSAVTITQPVRTIS